MSRPRFLTTWPVRAKVTVGSLLVVLLVLALAVSNGDADGEATAATATTTTEPPADPSTSRPSTTSPSTATPSTSAAVPPPEPAPTTSAPAPTTTPPPPGGLGLLARLRVDDAPLAGPYDRDLFPTWLDLDLNGCDARDDTLTAESEVPVGRDGCDVTGGRWTSLYDGVVVTDPSRLDIDHVVPLGDAWRSGAHAWDATRRAAFANSLDDPDHLIAVTASTNRSKGDSAPDQWRPPQERSWCRYATAWSTIKITWSLTVTTSERDALGEMLATC